MPEAVPLPGSAAAGRPADKPADKPVKRPPSRAASRSRSAGSAPAPGTAPGATEQPPSEGGRMSDEERQRRIEEAAYYKAKERGFGEDRRLDDWLEAERELDAGHRSGG